MVKTKTVDRNDLTATVEHLRSQGAPDDVVAAVSIAFDDFAITQGNTQEELDELRAKVPESARFCLMHWSVIHGKIDV